MADEPRAPDGAILVFDGYTLDPVGRRLRRGDATVPLTAKAFDTLELLVRSAGRTVSKEELLKQVWPGTYVQEETLAQNISTVRRALGDSADSPKFVLTVPREGYRFVATVKTLHPHRFLDRALPGAARPQVGLTTTLTGHTAVWLRYISTAAITAVIAVAAILAIQRRAGGQLRAPMSAPPVRFEVVEPERSRFSTAGGAISMSPDGRHLAFLASDSDGNDSLWIRALDALESTQLPGTTNASQPFWSADSQSIAFFAGGALERIGISGERPQTICKLPDPRALAGSWNRDNLILFGTPGGLFRVAASGGTPAPVSLPGISTRNVLWPSFLPDGRFLFTVRTPSSEAGIYVGSLDGRPAVRVTDAVSSSMYTSPGYVIYASGGMLVGRRFDASVARVVGDPVPLADRVWINPGTARAVFSASDTGVLAYREPQLTRLQWISRSGRGMSAGPSGVFHSFRVGNDGRVLVSQMDSRTGTYDILLLDSGLTTLTRLTFEPGQELDPVWRADGTGAVFGREGSQGWQLYEVKLDRSGVEQPLLPQPSRDSVRAATWDGDVLRYWAYGRSMPSRLWTLHPGRNDPPTLVGEAGSSEAEQRLSPDGNWLAYTANITDSRVPQTALFIRSSRGAPGLSEIAPEASAPRWRSDGGELFFIAPGGRLMAQRVADGRRIGAAVELCKTEALASSGLAGPAYDAAPDGQRFLVKVLASQPAIIVRTGWFSALAK